MRKRFLAVKNDFSIEFKYLLAVLIVGVVLTILSAIVNYFTHLPPITYIFSIGSTLFFIGLLVYSLKVKNFFKSYYIGFLYVIVIFFPVLWIINSGSVGPIQYYSFFFLAVLTLSSKHKGRLIFLTIFLVIIWALLIVEYLHPEIILLYGTREDRLIDVAINYTISLLAIYVILKIYMDLYRKANKTIQDQNHQLKEQNITIAKQKEAMSILNSEKDKLFRIIGHDLKGPFNSILGFSEILIKKTNDYGNEQMKEIVEQINKSSATSFELVQDLLEWASSQQGGVQFNPVKIPLEAALTSTIELLQEQAKNKEIELNSEINSEIMANIDVPMIKTSVRNIISNAIKFTHKGGEYKYFCNRK